MRIIVMSDSHGNYKAVESVILRCSDADMFIHLGDGEHDLNSFILMHMDYSDKIKRVAGNCDYNSMLPGYLVIPAAGHKIFAAHGHSQAVKNDLSIIKRTAAGFGCDIILYGHTHVRYNKYEDGFYIMNPGSVSIPHDSLPPSFGTIDISPAGILTNIADV
ncbi:MAG: YfcE family phosphodiesterase [Ruminococcus sp.]|nr:YfcE family phosphodiesterase [Ruminococcus sp.]